MLCKLYSSVVSINLTIIFYFVTQQTHFTTLNEYLVAVVIFILHNINSTTATTHLM